MICIWFQLKEIENFRKYLIHFIVPGYGLSKLFVLYALFLSSSD